MLRKYLGLEIPAYLSIVVFFTALAAPLWLPLAGCTTFQQVQQLPLDRRLELAYQTHTEVTLQVAAALHARQISGSTAKAYLELAEGSRKVLDEARALWASCVDRRQPQCDDLSTIEARLQLAKDVLTRAQAELLKRDPK